jgi:hypothetical protein
MEAPAPIEPQRRRFHDGGAVAVGDQVEVPPTLDEPPRIVLERRLVEGEERFLMLRRIGYADRRLGELLVPRTAEFTTDLASVPMLFTWLVPKSGAHLPAALVHDGLCAGDYVAEPGTVVTRVDADRVFRDAMGDTGTTLVRRWLAWAAVATATMVHGRGTGWSAGERWRYRIAAVGTLGIVAVLGLLATLDLVDVASLLPWMGERTWWRELLLGGAFAVLIPAVLALTWGRFRTAGWVMGIGLALLLHVTVALVLLTGLYRAVEWAAEKLARQDR